MRNFWQRFKSNESQTPEWALKRIRVAQANYLPRLDLNNQSWAEDESRLDIFPPEIFDLTWLQSLELGFNNLKSIPDSLAQLASLKYLNLRGNKLTDVPEVISHLTELSSLDLSFNQLTSIPEWLIDLPKLETLYLTEDKISTPPPEILKLEPFEPVKLELLQAYFRQRAEVGEKELYEAKLLIVGEPGAGKTSLTRKLINPQATLSDQTNSTEGIDVHTWMFPIVFDNGKLLAVKEHNYPSDYANKSSIEKDDEILFRVNIWDFGGQEIYHATHQFFLTRRSLYVIVADAREQKTDFYHWLNLIEHLSDLSPVIIFNNAFQNRHWAINEQQLQTYFPKSFQKPLSFNLQDDAVGLFQLRQQIKGKIISLDHVGDMLPSTWVNVRLALENDSRSTVMLEEFMQLCKDNGFTRSEDAWQLSSYLHDIGVILHFQDDPLLKRTIILKPEWGTDAVYRILDNEQVEARLGRFTKNDLSQIWHENEYALLHDELLALMMKFQLCYAVSGQEDTYIAPQLLNEQPPKYSWRYNENLHLRYRYMAFMPKGLLTRFIATMHSNIVRNRKNGEQLVWRTGVVLFKDDTLAEIVEDYQHREIRIRIAGKNRRDLLTIIRYELEKLHQPFHRLRVDELIPCNCASCLNNDEPHFYKLDTLKTRLEHRKTVIECDIPPFATVQIRPLLDDIGAPVNSADLSALLRMLNRYFNDDELQTLCLELSVNYENLRGEGLQAKQRELLLVMKRNGRLPELINLLRQKRPNFNW